MNDIYNSEKDKSEWAKLLYDNLLKDIKFAKDKQLKVVYYTVLINYGIYFLVREIKYNCFILLLIIIYSLISIASLHLINKIDDDLNKNRKYIETIRNHYHIIRILLNEDKRKETSGNDYPVFFSIVVISSAIIFVILKLING
ncbi:MAG: hypothetical protein C4567_08745 [Deltaproteobacteria bacterium]|nr:MAG: hypothetical protein C4567_08745 [Deltaproteobacteria bacterium]